MVSRNSLRGAPWLRGFSVLALVATLTLGFPLGAAFAQTAGGGWSPGASATGDDTYVGQVDTPAPGATVPAGAPLLIGGWVVDKTAQGWAGIDDVEVSAGAMGQGSPALARGLVAQNRPDVAQVLGNPYWAASGFSVLVPGSALQPGATTLTVSVHTPSKGWWSRTVTFTVLPQAALAFPNDPLLVLSVLPGAGDSSISQAADYTFTGWALDRNVASAEGGPRGAEGSGIDRVQLYLGAPRGAKEAVFLGEADLGKTNDNAKQFGSQFDKAGWELSFHPASFRTGNNTLYVYARSAVTGKETLETLSFSITPTPESTS